MKLRGENWIRAISKVYVNLTFSFAGRLVSHFDSHFDAFYTLSLEQINPSGNYYSFDGYTGTKIFWDTELGQWKMVRLGNRTQFATCETDDYPFGTHEWKLNGVDGKEGGNMKLNLNGCFDKWQFNCYDESCIDTTAR